MQAPLLHVSLPEQALPQRPQLLTSLSVATQLLPQLAKPELQT
jgi:hypothetical protein